MSSNDNENNNNIIDFKKTKPLGIDFNNFNDFNITIKPLEQSPDDPIIKDLNENHSKIKSILLKRRNSLKTLSDQWVKGGFSQTIQSIGNCSDLGVVKDFFDYAFMTNAINKDYLKLEHSVLLLHPVTSLIKSRHEPCFRTGIKMVCMLFDMYSSTIEMVKRRERDGINADETMRKYNALIDFFEMVTKLDTVKNRNLDNDQNLKILLQEMGQFITNCRRGY